MFLTHKNQRCAYKNQVTLCNDVYNDFFARKDRLIHKLKVNVIATG
jgi:hypothetical protein